MNHGADDEYLWSKRGGDAEIERLERLLAPFAQAQSSEAMPWRQSSRPAWRAVARARHAVAFAVAASVLMTMLLWCGLQWRLAWPTDAGWQLQAVSGDVQLDGRSLAHAERLAVGGELRTGRDGGVHLKVARIGEARLGAASQLRLVQTRTGTHRLQLVQGRLWARVWAPPQQFGVQAAGFEVLDLGCEFVIESDVHGNGHLRVRNGWVLVDAAGAEVLVPQGARVDLAAGGMPGTPYDEGASAAFVAALRAIDATDLTIAADGAQIARLLAAARREDAISLLSLLARRPTLAEGPLYDHLRQALPQAPAVRRDAIAADPVHALEPWWQALPYPRVKRWWLHWPDMLPAGDVVSMSPVAGDRPAGG
ncbi:hypothetical protein [Luteimonas sp. TWI1437]|uniref:hypothetical protein n=1 Tax=unclassified Luteimonas TaxID=2629088 RepID=UPI0032082F5E